MIELSAIIFDLDDTLYPERSFVLSGFRAAADHAASLAPVNSHDLFTHLQQLYEDGVRGNTFKKALSVFGHDSTALEKAMLDAYRNHTPQIDLFPDVVPTLLRLQNKYQLGLISDGYLSVQQHKFDALGVADYFDAVVFSDEFGRADWKPSTKPFQVALDRLQLRHGNLAVYVADNVIKDFFGARQLGIHTIQIRRAASEYLSAEPPTDAHKPDLKIHSLTELASALAQLS